MPLGTTSSIACGLSSRVLHLGDDVPGIDRERDCVALSRPRFSRSAATAGCHSSSVQAIASQAAAARPMRIERPGDERAAAKLDRELVGGAFSRDVVPGGNEHELRREAAGDEPPDRAGRRAEAPPGRTRSCVAAVAPSTEICTHSTASAARRSAARSSMRLPSVSILSATPPAASRSKSVPAVRHAERLAAAEGDVGNAGIDDAAREVERLVAAELVAPGAVGAGFLAAGDAARAAAVGELPGKKKGRAVFVYRAPRHCGQLDYFR